MENSRAAKRLWQRTETYDQKLEQRAAKHECLRDRNNVTTCRSPGLHQEAEWKSEMRRKRQKEFQKRRQLTYDVVATIDVEGPNQEDKVTLRSNRRRTPPVNRRSLVMAQDLGITWLDLHSLGQATWVSPTLSQGTGEPKKTLSESAPDQVSLSAPHKYDNPPLWKLTERERGGVKSHFNKRNSSSQTGPGYITIREMELLQLADYLKEALWREEALTQKLALLQQSTSTLAQHCDKAWGMCSREDLMKSKIGSLESQLQICIQRMSKDGVKKLLVQLEQQRQAGEERSLASLQRLSAQHAELQGTNASLERALQIKQAESAKWQELYKEQRVICLSLQASLDQSSDELDLLRSKMERAESHKTTLEGQLLLLQQSHTKLHQQLTWMEKDQQGRRDSTQSLTGGSSQNGGTRGRRCLHMPAAGQLEDQLTTHPGGGEASEGQHTLEDTDPLQPSSGVQQNMGTEEDGAEAERETELFSFTVQPVNEITQSTLQTSLNADRKRRRCSSCVCWCVLFLFLVSVATCALVHHPITRHQLQCLYWVLKAYTQQYLQELALPEYSKCQRPI